MKKVLVLILALAMAFTMAAAFTGCGNGYDETEHQHDHAHGHNHDRADNPCYEIGCDWPGHPAGEHGVCHCHGRCNTPGCACH
ncbi:MAG: hypothetical protein FWE40_01225 [Oscillospiraceae bacterium]|nr:hypothetical protein [Oscillospiraceae bacterium]